MLSALKKLLPERAPESVRATYIALLAQARNPFFFTRLGVPDTLDGRFEVIALHMFLLQQRLYAVPGATDFARHLAEEFFADMDRSLRQLGVMDTGLSKRMKRMARAYNGRLIAYSAATDSEMLKAALARNLYGTVKEGDVALLDGAGAYVTQQRKNLAATADAIILAGSYVWPDPVRLPDA